MTYDSWKLDNGEAPNHETSHATQVFCEEIDASEWLEIGCCCAENMTGAEIELDSTATVIGGEEIAIHDRVNIGVRVSATDSMTDVIRKRAEVYRAIADALDRQIKPRPDAPKRSTPVFEMAFFVVATVALGAMTVFCWRAM